MLVRRCRVVAAALFVLLPLLLAVPARAADGWLPAPWISRALDAVLIPVDDDVAAFFDLGPEPGVLVLAVQPGGLADYYGIAPGDVISYVDDRPVFDPRQLDALVLRVLRQGGTDFYFDLYRAGIVYIVETVITIEYYDDVVWYEEVATWESWSYESFNYSEYYEGYSVTIEETYYEQDTLIEEAVVEEEAFEEEAAVEPGEDGFEEGGDEGLTDDAFCAGEMADDGGCLEDGALPEDEMGDEGVAMDEPIDDVDDGGEVFDDEDPGDETFDDGGEEGFDDGGGEGFEEGVDGGGDEEFIEN